MAQVTKEFCDQMLVHASRKEHAPLTIHEEEQLARLALRGLDSREAVWISMKDRLPDTKEPVVYARYRRDKEKWHVGIAYWTVSQKWNPEQGSLQSPNGYTHWMPLPASPKEPTHG